MKIFSKKTIYIILIILAGVIIYGHSLSGKFIWDDNELIVNNAHIKNARFIPEIFRSDLYRTYDQKPGQNTYFYRPLTAMSFLVDYHIWRLNPWGYHLTNCILHILAALLVFALIRLITGSDVTGFFTALLFCVHPAQVEAVAYVSGRADLLMAVFLLSAYVLFARARSSTRLSAPGSPVGEPGAESRVLLAVGSALCYLFALLSKESALMGIGLFLLYDLSLGRTKEPILDRCAPRSRIGSLVYFMFAVVLGVYFLLRSSIPQAGLDFSISNIFTRFAQAWYCLLEYLRIVFFPIGLHMERGMPAMPDSASVLFWVIPIVMTCISIFLFIIAWKKNRIVFWGLGWFFIGLLPVLNIIVKVNAPVAEHWLYLPCIGIFIVFITRCLAPGAVTVAPGAKHRVMLIMIGVWVVVLMGLSIRQVNYWKDPAGFYKRTIEFNPRTPRMYINLALVFMRQARFDKAVTQLEKAVEISENNHTACVLLGNCYFYLKDYEKALSYFENGLALNPYSSSAYIGIGSCYYAKGDLKSAEDYFHRAVKVNPYKAKAYYNLALIASKRNNDKEAVELITRAIELDPDKIYFYENLANFYWKQKHYEDFISVCRNIVRMNPEHKSVYHMLGIAYTQTKDYKQAEQAFLMALENNPNDPAIYQDFANYYNVAGKPEKAREILAEVE